jgi:Flp pilus assembly protein TadD
MTSPRPLQNKPAYNYSAAAALALLLAGCGGALRPVEEQTAVAAPGVATAAAAPVAALDPRILSDYLMGVNSYKAGNLKTAESIFNSLVKEHPELAGPHANLGTIHVKRGEFDKAEVELNQALALNPNLPEVHNQLGILYRSKGQFDKALQSYQEGLKLAPDNPNLLLNLGILYDLYLNQPQEALQQWQHYKRLVGEDKQVDSWIADINQRTSAK